MKAKLAKFLLVIGISFSIGLLSQSAQAQYRYYHDGYRYYHDGYRYNDGIGFRAGGVSVYVGKSPMKAKHWRGKRCHWVGSHWYRGHWYPAKRVCYNYRYYR